MRDSLREQQDERFSLMERCLREEQGSLHQDIVNAIEERKAGPTVSNASFGEFPTSKRQLTFANTALMKSDMQVPQSIERQSKTKLLDSIEQDAIHRSDSASLDAPIQARQRTDDDEDEITQICKRSAARYHAINKMSSQRYLVL